MQFDFSDISKKKSTRDSRWRGGSKYYGIHIKQVGCFSPLLMKIYWIYMFGCFDKSKVLWQLHTREINQTGETWECDPAHALCLITPSHYVFVFTSMASLPRLFPYFVYFAPIVFRGIVSMLIPAEIWGRRWGRITEGAICGSSSYQHHHQYHHFNHNIIIVIILLRDTRKKI